MGSHTAAGRQRFFAWVGPGEISAEYDLRQLGWGFRQRSDFEHGASQIACPMLLDGRGEDGKGEDAGFLGTLLLSVPRPQRRRIAVVGLPDTADCAAILRMGYGEALKSGTSLEEIGARAERIDCLGTWVPRFRNVGPLHLDLVDREAFADGRSLDLNPREFSLLWRLADEPRSVVSKQALIQDVWRMGFVPETNSIAVHMSRLRRKLGYAGLASIIATAPEGGYLLALDAREGPAAYRPLASQSAGMERHAL